MVPFTVVVTFSMKTFSLWILLPVMVYWLLLALEFDEGFSRLFMWVTFPDPFPEKRLKVEFEVMFPF